MIEGVGGATSAHLAEFLTAVDRFCAESHPADSQAQLGADLIALRNGLDRAELEFSRRARAFEQTDHHWQDGAASGFEWIRHNCRMSVHATAQSIAIGEQLGNLPQTVRALEAGEIGLGHLAQLARLAQPVNRSESRAQNFDETALLAEAREVSVSRFRHLVKKARHMFDREGVDREGVLQHDRRRLRFIECEDGMVAIDALLDSVAGATLMTALAPLSDYVGADDFRSLEMRFADALVEMATRVMDSGRLPSRRRQRSHVQVTTTLETLMGLAGAPAADMEFGLPISSKTVQRFACSGSVTRILLGSKSMVIDVGREKRVVSAALSKAVIVRDRHCRWPGCQRPAAWGEEHHLVPWARGGATDLENLVLLCHRHHWLVHEGGWQTVKTGAGQFITVPPPFDEGRWRPPGVAA